MNDNIIIKKAKVHNLKSINLEIPKNKLIVITGLSGSGKSTLASELSKENDAINIEVDLNQEIFWFI